jgi:hypothetical protein
LCLWKIYYLLVQLLSIRQRKLHPQSGFFEFGKLPLNEGSWQETKHFAKMLYLLGFQNNHIDMVLLFYCAIRNQNQYWFSVNWYPVYLPFWEDGVVCLLQTISAVIRFNVALRS